MNPFELIGRAQELISQLPSDNDLPDAIEQAGYDPVICIEARPFLRASKRILAQLEQFNTPTYIDIFSQEPVHRITKIVEALTGLNSLIERASSVLRKAESNNIGRPNVLPSMIKEISASETLLLDLFDPLITKQQLRSLDPGALAGQIEQLSARIEQREKQAIAEQRAAESAVLAEDNVEQLSAAIKHHENEAAKWFKFYVGVLIFTFWVMIWMFANSPLFFFVGPRFNPPQWLFFQEPEDPVLQAVRLGVGKLVLASFIIGICVITGRIYQTHIHNVIVNRQRKMASVAFLQLYKALDPLDSASKNNLVVQACQAIFTHSSTGFLPKGSNEFVTLAGVLAEAIKKAKE